MQNNNNNNNNPTTSENIIITGKTLTSHKVKFSVTKTDFIKAMLQEWKERADDQETANDIYKIICEAGAEYELHIPDEITTKNLVGQSFQVYSHYEDTDDESRNW